MPSDPGLTSRPDAGSIRGLPKVVLHDHLDGGVRPETLLELAAAAGRDLPADEPGELAAWFERTAAAGSLAGYLETFEHTVGAMQSAAALARVAREAVLDHAADGVVHVEVRWAPEQHLAGGLGLDAAVEAVAAGLAEGVEEAAARGWRIRAGQILAALRHHDRAADIAALALAHRDRGVLGFDLAGPEIGFPAQRHEPALRALREASFPVTIHAGEAAGPESVADAVHHGLALRLGHGVRVIEDVTLGEPTADDPWGLAGAVLGPLAHWVRDQQVALEVCPSSNLQTGVAPSIAAHPVTALARLGFAVAISTDNRLMSATTASREFDLLVTEADWTLGDLLAATLTAAHAAFLHHDERTALVEDVILPAYTDPKGPPSS